MANHPKVTVFIPTYNGERYLAEIITSVMAQRFDDSFELLIIDSGSKDSTLEIIASYASKHKNIRVHTIPNTEYGHGKTRNLAAEMAKGEIVVYISHDATPSHDRWLYEMVRPFEINDGIVGVMGKQIPRVHCIPMLKSEIRGVFAGLGPDFGTTVFYKDDFANSRGVYDAISFYSDSNSAARKSYLLGDIPYKDVPYAEDQLFGRDIIDASLYKVYAPRGSVVHSNDLTLTEYKYRMFDETRGLRTVGIAVDIPTYKTIAKLMVRGIIRDARNITHDPEYSFKRKCYWLLINPFFQLEKWRGVRGGATADILDTEKHSKHSLESKRKRDS